MLGNHTANLLFYLKIGVPCGFESILGCFCLRRIVVSDLIFDNLKDQLLKTRIEGFGHIYYLPQHFLYFFPLPHGQGSLGPGFGCSKSLHSIP